MEREVMREDPRGAQSDRKGVDRSRGQGETVSHRPESLSELSGSLYTLSLSCSRMHLRAVAGTGCKRVTERSYIHRRGAARHGECATRYRPRDGRWITCAVAALHTVYAIQVVSETADVRE